MHSHLIPNCIIPPQHHILWFVQVCVLHKKRLMKIRINLQDIWTLTWGGLCLVWGVHAHKEIPLVNKLVSYSWILCPPLLLPLCLQSLSARIVLTCLCIWQTLLSTLVPGSVREVVPFMQVGVRIQTPVYHMKDGNLTTTLSKVRSYSYNQWQISHVSNPQPTTI